jgi:hypothetical protein
MATLTIIFPGGVRLTITPRRWLAAALWGLLALLMWSFVSVLQQGVERGERMRAEQLRVATQPPVKAPPRAAAVKTAQIEPQ